MLRQQKLEENRATASPINLSAQPFPEIPAPALAPEPEQPVIQIAEVVEEAEDETTLKLRKLKTLYDKHLITQEEYEAKKANILDSL
ncbi:hypothetical protein D3C73_1197430 [compost metagenome]